MHCPPCCANIAAGSLHADIPNLSGAPTLSPRTQPAVFLAEASKH